VRASPMTTLLLADIGATQARFAILSSSSLGPVSSLAVAAFPTVERRWRPRCATFLIFKLARGLTVRSWPLPGLLKLVAVSDQQPLGHRHGSASGAVRVQVRSVDQRSCGIGLCFAGPHLDRRERDWLWQGRGRRAGGGGSTRNGIGNGVPARRPGRAGVGKRRRARYACSIQRSSGPP
jgi:hypothetical protein